MSIACETCIFWTRDREGVTGDCRRRAPHGLPEPQTIENGEVRVWYLRTEWPQTNAGNFCGDHAFGTPSPDAPIEQLARPA